jgi:hypothetical protein
MDCGIEPQDLDLSASPGDELVKEVYAHFGLCIYLAGVFETGLINILAQLSTAADASPTRATFARYYSMYESFTFGNLISELKKRTALPQDLLDEASERKKDRDYLAHRYFRDRDMDFVTVGGCLKMIHELSDWQQKFESLDEKVTEHLRVTLAKSGLWPTEARLEQQVQDRLREARLKYKDQRPKN